MPDARSAFGRFSREVIARHFCCSCVYVWLKLLALLAYTAANSLEGNFLAGMNKKSDHSKKNFKN
jgi:hypothetical protein